MGSRKVWTGLLMLALGGVAVHSGILGQERFPAVKPTPPTIQQAVALKPESLPPRVRDVSKLPLPMRQLYLSAQRGADWLQRANRPDGRFMPGFVPSLRVPLEGDDYLRQAGAALAVARAARFFGDDKGVATARQAVLTLLLETSLDPSDKQVRYTTVPSSLVNRLAAAGLLVAAIHELPSPATDLLEQADQLCNFIKKQQRPDGSLNFADDDKANQDPAGISHYPGPALYGLMRSMTHRPAAWKVEVVRKARGYYQAWWQKNKNDAFVPWQTAAYAEAYLLTKDKAFADCVNEMNDWLCTLQYQQLDPRRPQWLGGFQTWADGKAQSLPPTIRSAAAAESLAEACRVVRQTGDLARHQSYRQALERALQFVAGLQYTDGNVQHFADWYRPVLVGAYHASHQDGDLRLDYNQQPVCALVQYLSHVAELP